MDSFSQPLCHGDAEPQRLKCRSEKLHSVCQTSWAIPHDGSGARNLLRKSLDGFGTNVERHHVVWNWLSGADNTHNRISVNLIGNDVINGQQKVQFASFRILQDLTRKVELILLYQGLAYGFIHCLKECVGHASADNEPIHFVHEILDDADLIADLSAAQDGDEGPLWVVQGTTQVLQFFFH